MSANVETTRLMRQLSEFLDVELSDEEVHQFDYQGFDYTVILRVLSERKKGSENDFFKEISLLMVIAVVKGNISSANERKMAEGGFSVMSTLIKKYGILIKRKPTKPTDVTFPRILASMPALGVMVAKKKGGKRYPNAIFKTNILPDSMNVSTFPSVIPFKLHDEAKQLLLILCLCYSVDQAYSISPVKQPITTELVQSLLSKQEPFVGLAHDTGACSDSIRLKVFLEEDFSDQYDNFMVVISKYKEYVPSYVPPSKDAFFKHIDDLK